MLIFFFYKESNAIISLSNVTQLPYTSGHFEVLPLFNNKRSLFFVLMECRTKTLCWCHKTNFLQSLIEKEVADKHVACLVSGVSLLNKKALNIKKH